MSNVEDDLFNASFLDSLTHTSKSTKTLDSFAYRWKNAWRKLCWWVVKRFGTWFSACDHL